MYRTSLLVGGLFALSATVAFAADDTTLSDKVKKDNPGTSTGMTADPTAKPSSGSISDKAKMDSGANSSTGTTAMPNAKPTDPSSINDKEMKDNPGASK